jgi:hypothetical protein
VWYVRRRRFVCDDERRCANAGGSRTCTDAYRTGTGADAVRLLGCGCL